MSATSLEVVTLVFPNPEWDGGVEDYWRVNSSLSFDYLTSLDLRTLSTNTAQPGTDVRGLLYVPTLVENSECWNASEPYVPTNVTRRANLPDSDYNLVAIAPWLSPTCVLEYLAVARDDGVRSFIFYPPGNGTAEPPSSSSSMWSLGDNENWKKTNHFPVYVTAGATGTDLMQASSHYSGNMTDVPYGHVLTEYYDSRDYVRLFVDVSTGGGTSLPSLWVFLLIVLGILLAVIILTSASMHYLQRRRRETLRRRVANGEVDLEALGIKRLTVPQELLDQMPLYTYGTLDPVPSKLDAAPANAKSDASNPATLLRGYNFQPGPLQQPTCAICLDDFIPAAEDATPTPPDPSQADEAAGTTVRQLPCLHIFHPECVDTFLRDSSSLCPMCKKSALPRGYCPRVVTNAMVRRERMVRRLRPLVVESDEPSRRLTPASTMIVSTTTASPPYASRRARLQALRQNLSFRSSSSTSSPFRPRGGAMTELAFNPSSSSAARDPSPQPNHPSVMTSPTAPAPVSATDPPSPHLQVQIQPPSTPGRREWARQRAVAMLGRRAPLDPEADDAQAQTTWRKAWRGVFPGGGSGEAAGATGEV